MRWFWFLFLPTIVLGATGDPLWLTVDEDGWYAQIAYENLSTNGTFDLGWGATNLISTSTPKLTLTVDSPGFTASAASTTVTRTVYGTERVRFPFPNEALPDTVVSDTSNVIVKVALSDFVHSNCTITAATALSGLYTGGTASASGTISTLTNSSTLAYHNAIANWSWPGFNAVTGASFKLRAVGFQAYATAGKPLACMQFIVSDQSANSVTQTVASMSIDSTLPDILGTGEYVATIDLSGLDDQEALDCDFVAYPWVGTLDAVLDTRDGTYTWPTALPTTFTNFNDKGETYSDFIAVVDPAGAGGDPQAVATNDATAVASNNYFATITAAAIGLAASNNTVSAHNDVGGSIIYLRAGTNDWMGSGSAPTGVPAAYVNVENYPGDTAVINSDVNPNDMGDRIKITGCTIATSTGAPFNSIDFLWFDGCTFDTASAELVFHASGGICHVTHCTVIDSQQGFKPFVGARQVMFSIVRGNSITGTFDGLVAYTVIGNQVPTRNDVWNIVDGTIGQSNPSPEYGIIYNNDFRGMDPGGAILGLGDVGDITKGYALVQNTFEFVDDTSAASYTLWADDTLNYTNILVWHNYFLGSRTQFGYNDTSTNAAIRTLWSVKNNMWDYMANKDDTFVPGDGARTGNWAVAWSVGFSGNFNPGTFGIEATTSSFTHEFTGIASWEKTGSNTSTNTLSQFFTRLAYDSVTVPSPPGAGGGDYRVQATSPHATLHYSWVLPYTLDGTARTASGSIGPLGFESWVPGWTPADGLRLEGP